MSQILYAGTKIANALTQREKDCLEETMKLLAKIHGGNFVKSVTDYYGRRIAVLAGVTVPDLPHGIGVVNGQDGCLKIVGDPFLRHAEFTNVAEQFMALHSALQLVHSQRAKGVWAQLEMKDGRPVPKFTVSPQTNQKGWCFDVRILTTSRSGMQKVGFG